MTVIECQIIKEALLNLAKSSYKMPDNIIDYRQKLEIIMSAYDDIQEIEEKLSPKL